MPVLMTSKENAVIWHQVVLVTGKENAVVLHQIPLVLSEWSNLSLDERVDSVLSAFEKQDESSLGSLDNRSDQVYDGNNQVRK